MKTIDDRYLDHVYGGSRLTDAATYIGWAAQAIEAAYHGLKNLADFAGEEPLLEAIRGGNLGADMVNPDNDLVYSQFRQQLFGLMSQAQGADFDVSRFDKALPTSLKMLLDPARMQQR